MRKRKKTLVFGIVLLLLFLGIGYAYLTTTLSINGTTDIDSNVWDVYFDNVNVTTGSVTGEQEIEAPTITSDTEVEYHIRLKEPGEFYEFTIDAKNDGTIDAMIETITKKVNGGTTIPAYLNYTVTYEGGDEISENHLLAHESLETYKVRVEYRNDINAGDLPSTAQNLTLAFEVEYVQADSNAQEVVHGTAIYTVNWNTMSIGQAVPVDVIQYNNPADATEAFGNPYFLKHIVQNGIITASYAGFVVTEDIASDNPGMTAGTYTLRGGGSTYNSSTDSYNNDSPYYEQNKETLLRAFGNSYCTENSGRFVCSVTGFSADAYMTGEVDAIYHYFCYIAADGHSNCGRID